MGCLYLAIEGQSCLAGSVDQGLMKNRHGALGPHNPKKSHKSLYLSNIFPIAMVPGIYRQKKNKRSLQTFRPNYRLSIVRGLTT